MTNDFTQKRIEAIMVGLWGMPDASNAEKAARRAVECDPATSRLAELEALVREMRTYLDSHLPAPYDGATRRGVTQWTPEHILQDGYKIIAKADRLLGGE